MTMAVIPASPGGTSRERVPAMFVGRDVRRAFLVSAVDIGRYVKPVPVNHLAFPGVVPHVDDHRLALLRA
jgi:hypothetical protein